MSTLKGLGHKCLYNLNSLPTVLFWPEHITVKGEKESYHFLLCCLDCSIHLIGQLVCRYKISNTKSVFGQL